MEILKSFSKLQKKEYFYKWVSYGDLIEILIMLTQKLFQKVLFSRISHGNQKLIISRRSPLISAFHRLYCSVRSQYKYSSIAIMNFHLYQRNTLPSSLPRFSRKNKIWKQILFYPKKNTFIPKKSCFLPPNKLNLLLKKIIPPPIKINLPPPK